jgi:hypothetical protein
MLLFFLICLVEEHCIHAIPQNIIQKNLIVVLQEKSLDMIYQFILHSTKCGQLRLFFLLFQFLLIRAKSEQLKNLIIKANEMN